MRSSIRRAAAVPAVLVAASLALGACGDDKTSSSSTSAGGSTGTTAVPADAAGFCAAAAELIGAFAGPPPETPEAAQAQGEAVAAAAEKAMEGAPDEAATQIEELQTTMANATGPDPALFEQIEAFGTTVAANCGDEELTVTAEDYTFTGIPETLEAGEYSVTFDNQGKEIHELLVFRKNPGTTESIEELLELPEEEAMTKVTQVGFAIALPGGSTGTYMDLTAGEYVALCFIPVGTTGLDAIAEGPPHMTQGMMQSFTVS